MSDTPPSADDTAAAASRLAELATGYFVSQAVLVAAELGIADSLAHGPRSTAELASDLRVHERSLYRLLRALASAGVFAEDEHGRFSLTPVAELLRSDEPGSQRSNIRLMVGQFFETWSDLIESVRTGQPAFNTRHGKSFFDHLAENSDHAQLFDDAMTARNERKTQATLEVFDLRDVRVLADIGGGNGSALIAILKSFPEMHGILFDRPDVIARARSAIEREKVAARCDLVAGDFLAQVPGGADVYLLRHILHNWDDDRSIAILTNVHRAMSPGARLLVVDRIIPHGNDPAFGKWMDLNMLVILGGAERTLEEFQRLFDRVGFRLGQIHSTSADVSLIEAFKS